MADFPNDPNLWPSLWTERTLGAVAGALVSVVYMLPKGRQEAASRFVTGLCCGLVFGGEAGLWLVGKLAIANLSPSEIMLSGSAAASISAWWGLGLLARIAERMGGDKPDL